MANPTDKVVKPHVSVANPPDTVVNSNNPLNNMDSINKVIVTDRLDSLLQRLSDAPAKKTQSTEGIQEMIDTTVNLKLREFEKLFDNRLSVMNLEITTLRDSLKQNISQIIHDDVEFCKLTDANFVSMKSEIEDVRSSLIGAMEKFYTYLQTYLQTSNK